METIPKGVLDNILLQLSDQDVGVLKASTTVVRRTIIDVEQEQLYWKVKVADVLGIEIPEEIKSDKWDALYNKIINGKAEKYNYETNDVDKAIVRFGNIDLLDIYLAKRMSNIESSEIKYFLRNFSGIGGLYKSANFEMYKLIESRYGEKMMKSRLRDASFNALRYADSLDVVRYFEKAILEYDTDEHEAIYDGALLNPNTDVYRYVKNELKIEITKDDLLNVVIEADNVEIFKEEFEKDMKRNVKIINMVEKEAGGNIIKYILSKTDSFEDLALIFVKYKNMKALKVCLKDERVTARFVNHILFRCIVNYATTADDLRANSVTRFFKTLLSSPLANVNQIGEALLTHNSGSGNRLYVLKLDTVLDMSLERKKEYALSSIGTSSNFKYLLPQLKNDDEFVLDCLGAWQYDKVTAILKARDSISKEIVKELLHYAEIIFDTEFEKNPTEKLEKLIEYLNKLS